MNRKLKIFINKLAAIPTDKYLHFIAGMIIAAFFALVIHNGRMWCIAPVVFMGVGKEIYDKIDYGRFDFVDLAYTVAGGLIIQIFALI